VLISILNMNETEDEFDEMKELIKNGIKCFDFIIDKSNDYDITFKECDYIFELVITENMTIMYEGMKKIISGVEFCCLIYDKIKRIETFDEFKKTIKFIFIDNEHSEHLTTEFVLVQALTKINIHLLWQLSKKFDSGIRNTPEEAVQDIINPIKSSQQFVEKIINELKK
jgi:hypothetical protein